MSKRQILEYLLESNTSISLTQVCLSLAMAVVLGMLLYFVYRKTYRGTVYSKDFNLTLLLVAIITTLVMQAIGSNLALSLGMVGSLSIIRFRTAVKEPRDIAFLFWAIAIGLTCGSEMYLIGLLGSVVLTVVVCLANLDLYDTTTYLLVLRTGTGAVDDGRLEAAVRNWDFSENEWACRDLLIAAFPDAVRFWSAEELLEMDTMELLGKVSEWKPEVGIQMMKLLLDTAECHLQEPEVAEQLLGNDLYELCQNQTVQPKLLAQLKEDARLVRQLFQSAYVGDLQEELLEACDWFGESMLKEHLQSLLAQNPHFKEFE